MIPSPLRALGIVAFGFAVLWALLHWLNPPLPFLMPESPMPGYVRHLASVGKWHDTPVPLTTTNTNLVNASQMDSLLNEQLQPIQKVRRGAIHHWRLGKGTNLPSYLLRTKQVLDAQGCQILQSKEIKDFKQALLHYKCGNQIERQMQLSIGEELAKEALRVAILFEINPSKSALPLAQAAHQLDLPLQWVFDPYSIDSTLFKNIMSLDTTRGIWIYQRFENSTPVPNRQKHRWLMIDQGPTEIQLRLDSSLRNYPTSLGIIPLGGERGLNHPPLMRGVLSELATREKSFGQFQGPTGTLSQMCREQGALCISLRKCSLDADLGSCLERQQQAALRTGVLRLVLPLDSVSIAWIKKWRETHTDGINWDIIRPGFDE
jgi:hypothetical protein